jgi:CHAD domain-containing protein
MNYELRTGKRLSEDIRRIARKQIGRAAVVLEAGERGKGRERSVHKARQWLKKARATLRLARPVIGEDDWRREDKKLRKAAKGLAQRRDAEAMVATVEKLRKEKKNGVHEKAWEQLEMFFLKQQEAAGADGFKEDRKLFKAVRRRAEDWPLKKLDWDGLCRGAGIVYAEGRKAMQSAEKTRSTEHLHEWRKRVKDLRYELKVFEAVRPKAVSALEEGMKKLGIWLGDDHDLSVLEAVVKHSGLAPEELAKVVEQARGKRAELQNEAFELGRKLFGAEAREFVKSVEDDETPRISSQDAKTPRNEGDTD